MPPTKRIRRTREEIDRDVIALGYPSGTKMTSAMIRQSKEKVKALDLSKVHSQGPSKARQDLIPIPDQPISVGSTTPKSMLQSTADRNSPRFDNIDLAYLINHMSSQANREILTGSGSKPKVGGLSRGAEWGVLSARLSHAHNDRLRVANTNNAGRMDMNGGDLMKRWTRIKSKYVETKSYWNRTGAGLMPNEEYRTIEEKQEAMCPMFKELDSIYGEKPNVKALKIHDSMINSQIEVHGSFNPGNPNMPMSQDLIVDPKNYQVSDRINPWFKCNRLLMTKQNERFQMGLMGNGLDVNDPISRFGVVGQPIPTFMETNQIAHSAAQAALMEFDYMPNTYNFARETYDYAHDTYDFDEDSNSINEDASVQTGTIENEAKTYPDTELTPSIHRNDTFLNLLNQSNAGFAFENSDGEIEDLGSNWAKSPTVFLQGDVDEGINSLSPIIQPETDTSVKDVNDGFKTRTQPLIEEEPKPIEPPPAKRSKSKKAEKAAKNLATREGAPLPALNADEIRRKKPIESALKQSDRDRFDFFDKQMALKNEKDQERNNQLADQAIQSLKWEREKFERETEQANQNHLLHREEQERTSKLDSDRVLLLAQNQIASEERRERREIIKECQHNKMSIPEIKEYLSLMFPETE